MGINTLDDLNARVGIGEADSTDLDGGGAGDDKFERVFRAGDPTDARHCYRDSYATLHTMAKATYLIAGPDKPIVLPSTSLRRSISTPCQSRCGSKTPRRHRPAFRSHVL